MQKTQQKGVLHTTLKGSNTITLDVRHLSRGQYFLHIQDGKKLIRKQVMIGTPKP